MFINGCGPGAGVSLDSKLSYKVRGHLKEKAKLRGGYAVMPLDMKDFRDTVSGIEITESISVNVCFRYNQTALNWSNQDEEDVNTFGVIRRLPCLKLLKEGNDAKYFALPLDKTLSIGCQTDEYSPDV